MKCTKELGSGYYITYREVSNMMGGYHPVNIVLRKHDDEDFYAIISNKFGDFYDFPGVVDGDWQDDIEIGFDRAALFTLIFYGFKDGKCLVRWLVQPDGRYFSDEDGFGIEPYNEVVLYSLLDTNGKFIVPFTPDCDSLDY